MLTHPVGATLVSHWTYLYWFPFAESGKHQKNRLCLLCSLPCIQVQCRTVNIYHFTDIKSRPFCPTSLQDIKFYRSAAEKLIWKKMTIVNIFLSLEIWDMIWGTLENALTFWRGHSASEHNYMCWWTRIWVAVIWAGVSSKCSIVLPAYLNFFNAVHKKELLSFQYIVVVSRCQARCRRVGYQRRMIMIKWLEIDELHEAKCQFNRWAGQCCRK